MLHASMNMYMSHLSLKHLPGISAHSLKSDSSTYVDSAASWHMPGMCLEITLALSTASHPDMVEFSFPRSSSGVRIVLGFFCNRGERERERMVFHYCKLHTSSQRPYRSVLSFIVVITLARVRQNDKSPPRDTKCATRPDHGHHLQQSQTVYDSVNLIPSQWVGWMMVGRSAVPAVGWMAG